MTDAIRTERTAKEMFLESLVAVVRESLPAICSKVPSSAFGRSEDYGKEGTVDCFPWRGVLVAGEERPRPPDKRVAFEKLEGNGLYIDERGRFIGVRFVGEYARDGQYHWEAREVLLTPTEVIACRWSMEEIAKTLAEELEIQAMGKEKASERAAKATAAVREAARILSGVR